MGIANVFRLGKKPPSVYPSKKELTGQGVVRRNRGKLIGGGVVGAAGLAISGQLGGKEAKAKPFAGLVDPSARPAATSIMNGIGPVMGAIESGAHAATEPTMSDLIKNPAASIDRAALDAKIAERIGSQYDSQISQTRRQGQLAGSDVAGYFNQAGDRGLEARREMEKFAGQQQKGGIADARAIAALPGGEGRQVLDRQANLAQQAHRSVNTSSSKLMNEMANAARISGAFYATNTRNDFANKAQALSQEKAAKISEAQDAAYNDAFNRRLQLQQARMAAAGQDRAHGMQRAELGMKAAALQSKSAGEQEEGGLLPALAATNELTKTTSDPDDYALMAQAIAQQMNLSGAEFDAYNEFTKRKMKGLDKG